ncbi:MAG: NADH-ubiquinone oxidoreductase-F iron-sulfur binding region domain-containing protein [Ilumatobacteraceae bacterium]
MGKVSAVLPPTPITTIDDYLEAGGGEALRAARSLGPEATIEEITASGLRGRGGAGFPTGAKWASVRAAGGTHYAVANGAEGEPATFKDRTLIRRDPYRIVEGLAIAAFCVDAQMAFVGVKRSFGVEVANLRRAALELGGAGLLGDLSISIVEGPDEYLFGEEKALLEVIEGRDPLPRLLPPWQHGLFATVTMGWESGTPAGRGQASNPTLVNNVETLASAAHVLARGATWYRSLGTADSAGTAIVTIVGDVRVPGVHEVELGTTLAEVISWCGGAEPNRTLKAAFSGVSNPVVPARSFDIPLTYEAFEALGSGLGAAGFAVYDDTADMVAVAAELTRFLAVESCGQCPPCKRGSMELTEVLTRIAHGGGTDADLATIETLLATVTDSNRCYLGTEVQRLVSSVLREFPDDVAAHLEGRPPRERDVVVPKIVEIDPAGAVVYDERHRLKLPDWTYADESSRR